MRWSWGREERRQGRLCGGEPGPFGSATWSLFPLVPAWQGCWGGRKRRLVPAGGWSGQHPCPVVAGEAAADEVAQVEGCGAVLEPGVVPGGAEGAELEAPPAAAGDLGDHPFDVGAELLVVLTRPGLGSPARARGPPQRVVLVQD